MSKRSNEELAYYQRLLARYENDPYKAPEQVVEARAWVAQAEQNDRNCTCDNDDIPFCAVHVEDGE